MHIDFRNISPVDRSKVLSKILSPRHLNFLDSTSTDNLEMADVFIENAIGYFQIPLGLAPGLTINGKTYPAIPLAIEETSVVAAISKTIKLINEQGTIEATTIGKNWIGQIHFPKISNPEDFSQIVQSLKFQWIQNANLNPCQSMVKRGGGLEDITVRILDRPDGHKAAILHLMMDTLDAMGANIVNQTCEYLRPQVEAATNEKALMSILSNWNTEKITRVTIQLHDFPPELTDKICEASLMAQIDPYRAVTHNKGVMNGMDALCIATGNDWRALEAGIHGHACKDGHYRGITQWFATGNTLQGIFEAPLNIGVIGGVTKAHPMAQLSLTCLNIEHTHDLAYVMGAVGLIQNLAALRALVTDGIVKGHMSLHISNLLHQTDASPSEKSRLQKAVTRQLLDKKYITQSDVTEHLKKIRLGK